MTRDEALKLVETNLTNKNLIKHSLAVEACMREMAKEFNQDIEQWGLAGLLHDLDYDSTYNTPDQHTLKTVQMLQDYHIPENILHAIKAHNNKAEPVSSMDISLLAIDPATGFITACALMHPQKKLQSLDLAFLQKRFKEKSFAKGANREQIKECSRLDLELDRFLTICLKAMQGIDQQLGL